MTYVEHMHRGGGGGGEGGEGGDEGGGVGGSGARGGSPAVVGIGKGEADDTAALQ